MARTTKASLRRIQMANEQAKRDAQCRANGHVWHNEYNHLRYCETCYKLEEYQWIQPGMTVTHRNDSIWTGKVLSVTSLGVRVRRIIDDAWGEHGSIECTFQPDELIIQQESEAHYA